MSETSTSATTRDDTAAALQRTRLSFDLDADICVVGAGLAGLTVALEAARLGASVAVLEGRHVGWNASGHQLGTVMPGYGLPIGEMIARIGFEDTRELWALSRQGAELVRANASEDQIPGLALSEGALEVSNVDVGDQLISRLQMLGEDFETEVEGWQVDRVRDQLRTGRYFHGVHYPKAFQIDGRQYVHGLAALARRAGARIFEDTPVVSIDSSGIRKRIVTPSARLRATHIVLAGNIHLGAPLKRLSETLLPVWRYAAVTEPLGERLAEVITFQGSVTDSDGVDHFRIVDGDRLMWASPETTWAARPQRFAGAIARRIRTIFPRLGKVAIAEVWGGATGQTVHGMPQIGQLRRGLWVTSGFGRQGLNTSAIAGHLIARSILWGDDRWRLGRAAGWPGKSWDCGAGVIPPHPVRLPATANVRAPRNASARRDGSKPIVRPEPGRNNAVVRRRARRARNRRRPRSSRRRRRSNRARARAEASGEGPMRRCGSAVSQESEEISPPAV
jgi:glycine/D-amino acid oxidase-like deaminating enzyme